MTSINILKYGYNISLTEAVSHFFSEYSKFKLHYASLEYNGLKLKDVIHGFLIGSELEGLTKYRNSANQFPAVNEFINLAGKTREVLGEKVKISYAVNWSEYHHSDDGWYHLDSLWADQNINYVGISAYFPLTSHLEKGVIGPEEVKEGWGRGEGFDPRLDDGIKEQLGPEWAIKDFEFWWNNYHKNPDNTYTSWLPKMKPIVFTEVGFTAVRNNTHAPYKYLYEDSVNNGLPLIYSDKINPKYQYDAFLGTLEFVKELRSKPGNSSLARTIYWYNIDPCGKSQEWVHNHELKVSEFENWEQVIK